MPVDGSYVADVLPTMLLFGIGAGLAFPALMTLAMSGATQNDAGLASGLVNTTQQVGGALGLAVLATLSTSRTEDLTRVGQLSGGRARSAATTSRSSSRSGSWLAAIAVTALVLRPEHAVAPVALQPDDGAVDPHHEFALEEAGCQGQSRRRTARSQTAVSRAGSSTSRARPLISASRSSAGS